MPRPADNASDNDKDNGNGNGSGSDSDNSGQSAEGEASTLSGVKQADACLKRDWLQDTLCASTA